MKRRSFLSSLFGVLGLFGVESRCRAAAPPTERDRPLTLYGDEYDTGELFAWAYDHDLIINLRRLLRWKCKHPGQRYVGEIKRHESWRRAPLTDAHQPLLIDGDECDPAELLSWAYDHDLTIDMRQFVLWKCRNRGRRYDD